MKKLLLMVFVALFATAMFAQQSGVDTLGGHLLNGRGCAGCHAPHSGARGNGIATADPTSGDIALWGGDLKPIYGQSFAFGDKGNFTTTMPTDLGGDSHGTMTYAKSDPRASGLMMCLSCHDGNLATGAMMKNQVWEKLPAGLYGATIPTLLGNDGGTVGDYKNDHPVGENATLTSMCGAYPAGDCTIDSNGKMTVLSTDTFYQNYGFTVAPGAYFAVTGGVQSATGTAIVVCTTCHDQHVMTVYNGNNTMGTPKGIHTTYFGVKGWYDPSTGGNNTAQFCRQCHYSRHSNEYNGVTNVPTN